VDQIPGSFRLDIHDTFIGIDQEQKPRSPASMAKSASTTSAARPPTSAFSPAALRST
jgi:hypothetical protein